MGILGGGVLNMLMLLVVSISIMDAYWRYLHGVPVESLQALKSLSRIAKTDANIGFVLIRCAALVASIELCVVSFILAESAQRLYTFNFSQSLYDNYDSLRIFFWEILPTAATFSALKALRFVHPSLVSDVL